ncbi:release factor [Coniochaeta ligniaria NRRL 30616]|uniref:Release factor n=1 Tax=Coniochaeta ligniaria NRRL 30616 TaxID=1408157 RepID=A0A1J7J5H1_9PEZI|nr:release factor [Coniochaeta ligniaria NRRL 30616]
MFTAPWVCRSCSRLATRSLLAGQTLRRRASTGPASLPPALLQRAHKLAAEHAQLSASLATDFDTKTAKRAGELGSVAAALKDYETAKASLAELNSLLSSTDAELRDLARDDVAPTTAQLDSAARRLSIALTPKHPFADMPCLIEFRPGPGGLESRFFTDSLFKMYQAYCTRKGYRFKVVKYETSDQAGSASGYASESPLQEAVLEIEDEGAYEIFRAEAGIHRVQRVPSTEKSGRTHTSAAALWVLPSLAENTTSDQEADFSDPESDFYIDVSEVKSEVMRARGAGGQHVNKTESAIRLTHVPTGIAVSMQDHRSQHRNREAAWKVLRSRLAQRRREEREELARSLRSSVLAKNQVTRGDKIRTYNYQQDRCTDHRSGVDVHNLPDVLAGGEAFERIIESVREYLVQNDIEAAIADEQVAANEQAAAEAKGAKK